MLDLARKMVEISQGGLQRRGKLSPMGDNEVSFLDPIREIAEAGVTKAEILLEHYHQSWASSVDPIYREFQF